MFVGVQERLVRPQPLDSGLVQGLVTALCGRYPCLRPVALGKETTALVLGQDCPIRVLMVASSDTPLLCLLRLCEEMAAHLRADLPLCEVSLARALTGRQVWFVPILHSTAGWEELQAFTQKNGENPGDSQRCGEEMAALSSLCHHTPFRHAVVVECGGETVSGRGGDASRLMAQVLSAVSGYAVAPPVDGGFARWFFHAFCRPALTLSVGEGRFEAAYAKAREALLLSLLF